MTPTEGFPGSQTGAPNRHMTMPAWITRPRLMAIGGTAVVGAGLALNWTWLTAIGAAPILLSLLPCAAMCALGLCMRGGGTKSCGANGDARNEHPSSVERND